MAKAIAEVAEKYRITQVVLGETRRSRWQLLWHGSLVEQLMALSSTSISILLLLKRRPTEAQFVWQVHKRILAAWKKPGFSPTTTASASTALR